MRVQLAVAAALASFLAGCSPGSSLLSKQARPDLPPIAAETAVETVWSGSVGESLRSVFNPEVTGNYVYAASARGAITQFDRASGRQLWRLETGLPLAGGVAANDLMVVVGTEEGVLVAHDNLGNLMWKTPLKSELNGPPVLGDGMVVVRTLDGHLYGLDALTGARRWDYPYDQPSLLVKSPAGMTIYRGAVFAGLPGGKLVALRILEGTVGWEAQVSLPRGATEVERINDVIGAPAVDDNQACAAAYQGRLACFELTSGTFLWGREISSAASLAQDGRNLYVTDLSGALHAFDKANGAHVWKQTALIQRQPTAPQVLGRQVLAGDRYGYLHVLAVEDGRIVGRQSLDGSALRGQPVARGNRGYVQTSNGQLSVFSLR